MRPVADTLDTRVLLRPTPSGGWIVRDARGERGGYFRDRSSAVKFIRRELGADVAALEADPPQRTAA